jgi:hypothetical protein
LNPEESTGSKSEHFRLLAFVNRGGIVWIDSIGKAITGQSGSVCQFGINVYLPWYRYGTVFREEISPFFGGFVPKSWVIYQPP